MKKGYTDERQNWTVYCSVSIPKRVKLLAAKHQVSMADLANFLLLYALEAAESGQLKVKTRVVQRQIEP